MKVSKKISLILICVMIVNMLFTFTAFATEDITGDVTEFALNTKTIIAGESSVVSSSTESYLQMQNGHYATTVVNTESEGYYKLVFKSSCKKDGLKVSVSVNGAEQISDAALANTGGFSTFADNEVGYITLTPGENKIKSNSQHLDPATDL